MQIDAIYFPNSCSMAVAEARWEGGREKKGQREEKKKGHGEEVEATG